MMKIFKMLFGSCLGTWTARQPGRRDRRECEGTVARPSAGARRPCVTLCTFAVRAARGVSASTADNYRTAVRSFTRFCGGRDVPLSSLDDGLLRRYERWLADGGVCPNTSSCYMRSLRAVYNKAVAARAVRDRTPFRRVFTGCARTAKRSLRPGEVQAIRRAACLPAVPFGRLELAADLFLFSFYAMGMPFVDLAHLTRRQVDGGVLTYRRRKTGCEVRVRLEPCMTAILEKYRTDASDLLFPVLYKVDASGRVLPVAYASALNGYNRSLKALAALAGVGGRLTSYVARHTWASLAYAGNVDLPVISQALGHADTQTTRIYISGIDDRRMEEANRKLLGEVLGTPLRDGDVPHLCGRGVERHRCCKDNPLGLN